MTRLLDKQRLPFVATLVVGLVIYGLLGYKYPPFFTPYTICTFFNDNPYLGIVAVGMTFVILSGGIDLSVGAMVGCTSIFVAWLMENAHWSPWLAVLVALVCGTLFGASMGVLIRFFSLPPFLVTLAGLFFCRGLGQIIDTDQISITNVAYKKLGLHLYMLPPGLAHYLGAWSLRLPAIIFITVLLIAVFVSLFTRFGRNAYALGGNEISARLMGLPVTRTSISIYALSGFCSALAGVVATLASSRGYALEGQGLELDAIAAVVVGGTLLTGGVGYVAGSLAGVLIFAMVRTSIGYINVTSSWMTIVVGGLLFIFILLQKLIQRRAAA